MADRGPSPLGDPGNLHVYSMNGGSHKLSEIVSDVSGDDPGLISSMPPNHLTSADYPLNPETQGLAMSYLNIAPLEYSDSYDEMKRAPHGGQYYGGGLEAMQCTSASFDPNMHGYPPQSGDMFGKSSDSMGYIHMLSSSDSMVPGLGATIKKEKIDFSEHGGASISCANPSTDIPYPPNTSMQDWHYYNSMGTRNVSPSNSLNQSNFGMMNLPAHGHQFHGNHVYTANPNTAPINNLIGMSNEDIHEQSRKISEGYMGTNWRPETLYKSNIYSNLVSDSSPSANSRRKRPDSDKSGRASKSRRNTKKPSEHSKTLSSDGSIAGKGRDAVSRSHLDDSVLNSSERNSLVTTLMNNLRSTVQYESFCLSFPRLHQKERAFHYKVLSTLNLIDSIGNRTIVSNPFPAQFVKGASKVVNTFRHALEKKRITSESNDSSHAENNQVQNTGIEESEGKIPEGSCYVDGADLNLSSDQVEEHLPHSMAWILKVGDRSLRAKWEGQFVVTVNPVHSTICVSVFEFRPNFSLESHKCLQQNKLTKELAQEIVENMEQFEVSRQLRFDVDLKKVVQMYLHTTHADGTEGCIVMEVMEKPACFQKWIHTSAEERNKWRRRQSFFTPEDSESGETVFVCIGGLLSELNELAALMLATNPDLQTVYNRGVDEPLISECRWHRRVENGDVGERKHDNMQVTKCARKRTGRRRVLDGNESMNTLRDEIVTALARFDIECSSGRMDNEIGAEEKPNLDPNRNRCNSENRLEIDLDPQLPGCFRDYVNYECDNASELSKFLETTLSPRSYGFYENDFDLNLVPDGDIDRLTVGELIASKCSETVYFSFCRKEVGQLGHDRHCSKCRTCNTWRYWHCDTCDRCSCSRLICEYCGRLRDDQSRSVIKPFSVFRSQEKAGTLSLDDVKPRWQTSLDLPDDDLLSMETTDCGDFGNGDAIGDMEYNSSNAMVDQLGLLNPVGFLLGQPSTGEGRKHRRYKGKQQMGKCAESQGSGCLLQ